jgi:hypothetical protein
MNLCEKIFNAALTPKNGIKNPLRKELFGNVFFLS